MEEFALYVWRFSYLTKFCYIIWYAYWDSRWLFKHTQYIKPLKGNLCGIPLDFLQIFSFHSSFLAILLFLSYNKIL